MILNRQRSIHVPRRPSESFLRKVCRELKLAASEVTICFVSDAEIARMNQKFRRKKGPTDVLSFPAFLQNLRKHGSQLPHRRSRRSLNTGALGSRDSKAVAWGSRDSHYLDSRDSNFLGDRDSNYLGDIAISPETAKRNAKKYGRTLADELKILILHGVLHLMGYDHESDRGEMDRIERKLRQRFGLA